jgi:hypothetical protein
MTRRRRIAVLAAVTALALSACTNQDADLDDVTEALEDTDALSSDQIRCVRGGFEDANFSQDELNDIGDAETLDDLPDGLAEEVRGVLDSCLGDSPTTTEGEGEGTTTEETTTTAG